MIYRREIDGLRALAVLPVILFHAGFTAFGGGFVGVDIFFVISGYLITSIILSEKEAGNFSLVNFYERRARRILPALFFVMFACIPVAWLWLLPSDMKDFSKSVRDVSIFMSNILFYRQSGYFDTASQLKPLLHTWSLAVEEQYYLFFPLLMLALWKYGRKLTPYLLLIIAAASLVYSVYKVGIDPNAAFFLLPSRLWELMIGSLLAYLVVNKHIGMGGNQFASFVGLMLILYAVFFFGSTPFPSLYALMPTIGAALIIAYATANTIVGQLLSNNMFVGVGLISYSAYLWHQPLFVFARHKSMTEPSVFLMTILVITTLMLAYVSWRFVETPFRNKQRFNRKQIFLLGALLSTLFVAFGLLGKFTNGYESRLSEDQRKINSFEDYDFKGEYKYHDCFLTDEQSHTEFKDICRADANTQSVLLWGDSYAAALSFGLRNELPNLIQYTTGGCPPIKDAVVSSRPKCKSVNDYVMQEIKRIKPRQIFLHANWLLYAQLEPVRNIKKTIDYIRSVSPSTKIIIIGAVPQWAPSLPNLMLRKGIPLNTVQHLKNPTLNNLRIIDKKFEVFAEKEGVGFFSAISAFCLNEICQITTSFNGKLMPTTWDYDHLTTGGSVLLARKLLEKTTTTEH
jgi:peptidoglycan/LPS O-acetylase OafA/YrhL